jgi:hypothetical protein
MDNGSIDVGRDMTRLKARLFERMRGMHRTWLEKAQAIRHLELDYGDRLMAAKTPSHAASLCNEWMAKRMAIIAQEQESFANSWVWLLADMIGSPLARPPEPLRRLVSAAPRKEYAYLQNPAHSEVPPQ